MNKLLRHLIDVWEVFANEVRYVFHLSGMG